MHIIKLNAIDSTNSYLKNMVEINNLENYTVVTAESKFWSGSIGNCMGK